MSNKINNSLCVISSWGFMLMVVGWCVSLQHEWFLIPWVFFKGPIRTEVYSRVSFSARLILELWVFGPLTRPEHKSATNISLREFLFSSHVCSCCSFWFNALLRSAAPPCRRIFVGSPLSLSWRLWYVLWLDKKTLHSLCSLWGSQSSLTSFYIAHLKSL